MIERDRRQPEGRLTFRDYNRRVLSPTRIERGRALMREHQALLERVAADYGVQPRFIVALWGIESNYGSFTGEFPVIGALATLAYEGRRAAFFRKELLQALRIVDQGDVTPAQMMGSWAGAMGQSQFMPSSYLARAVDYDRDGRRDIWTSPPDVFASIANYLAKAGWNDRHTWGRQVLIPDQRRRMRPGSTSSSRCPSGMRSGSDAATGTDLPLVALDASLLRMDDGAGPGVPGVQQFPRPDGVEPVDLFRADRRRARRPDRSRLIGAGQEIGPWPSAPATGCSDRSWPWP